MSKGRILILDGDSIAYRCSAAGEERSVKVTHLPTNKEKVFKHRTEFKQVMLERGKEITEDYSIQDVQTPEPIAFVINTIKNHIKRIEEVVQPEETIIFAGEELNFRLELALPKKYKGQRGNTIRPIHLKEAKKFLQTYYKAEQAMGAEVDDFACIAAYDALKSGYEPVMYFYEKDQSSFDGITMLYDNDSGFEFVKIPSLGELHIDKTAVKGNGLKFLAYQWICSDPVDNYCAYDLSSVKFGSKSAYKVLVDLKSEKEVLEAVIMQFKKFYPEEFEYTDWKGEKHLANWYSMLEMYYKCARMMRSREDKLNPKDLFEQYGVQI